MRRLFSFLFAVAQVIALGLVFFLVWGAGHVGLHIHNVPDMTYNSVLDCFAVGLLYVVILVVVIAVGVWIVVAAIKWGEFTSDWATDKLYLPFLKWKVKRYEEKEKKKMDTPHWSI